MGRGETGTQNRKCFIMTISIFLRLLLTIALWAPCSIAVAQPAIMIAPGTEVENEKDIAVTRPGTFRMHDVDEAKADFERQQKIGAGSSIGDIADVFSNMVHDEDPITLVNGASTRDFQAAIDNASLRRGGGVIRVQAGRFKLGTLKVRSNIRIEIDPDAILVMTEPILFAAGRGLTAADAGRAEQVVNFEITSSDRNRSFAISTGSAGSSDSRVPFLIASAYNFAISNVNVQDSFTMLPQVFLVPDSDPRVGARERDGGVGGWRNITFARCPSYGVIHNINGLDQHTGFGTVQVFCGSNLMLGDLSGRGGVTLRLEPGSGPDNLNMAGPDIGAMHDITARNISNDEGFAALYLKPHSKEIRNIDIRDVSARDSAFSVMLLRDAQDPPSAIYGRGHFSDLRLSGEISLRKTRQGQNSRSGRMAINFIAPQTMEGRTNWDDFNPDPSGDRWKTLDVIAPVLMATHANRDVQVDHTLGGYSADMSGVTIISEGLLREEDMLYLEDARALDGNSLDPEFFE